MGRCWQRLALPDAMCWGLAQRRDPPPPWALWLVFAEQPLAVGLHIPCPSWGWLGGAVMESLPCASGSATELPRARVRSCSAGMVLRIGPRHIFPLSCTFPFPSLPRARAQHSHGGTLVYRKCVVGGWGARRTRGSAGAAGALVPCLQPLRYPPPCVSLPGAPLQPLAPGTSYFCLFLRKRNNIIKL